MTPLFVQKGRLLRAIQVIENKLKNINKDVNLIDITRLETDYKYMINCFNYNYGHQDRRFMKKGRG